jgi:hypothetical protein
MTEDQYFDALHDLIHPPLKDAPKIPGGHYLIQEANQVAFELNIRGTTSIHAVKLEAMKGDWPCFRGMHAYAHKRCDRVVISWDRTADCPKYLLVELKSTNTGGAHKQLGASLAFCHFLHRMICVGQNASPQPKFGSVTVRTMPVALKIPGTPRIPKWNAQPLQPDCKHMHYDRSFGSLPLNAIFSAI